MAGVILTERTFGLLRGAAIAALLGGGLSACATVQSHMPLADLRDTTTAAPSSGGPLRGTDKPYQVNGQWYYPHADPSYDQVGMASWYGYPFQSRHTANGELFDQTQISGAHKTLPLPCIVEVTNLQNGRKIQVRINDRGPFVDGRLIDLSKAAAEQLGFDRAGLTRVRVKYIRPAAPLAQGMMDAAYRAPPRRLTPREQSVDGFDDIEQSDTVGRIRPTPVSQTPATPMDDYSPPPSTAYTSRITSSALPPIGGSAPVAAMPAAAMPVAAMPISSGAFAVQAGAFASRPAADRAAARLADAGVPYVAPFQRNGATLYRVTVGAFPDPDAAAETRARVIASGFTDARVVQTF